MKRDPPQSGGSETDRRRGRKGSGRELSEFVFSYRHESSECRLLACASGSCLHFYFSVRGNGHGLDRYDGIELTTRISVARILLADETEPLPLANEILLDVYSHGEPQRRKPDAGDDDRLRKSLVAWIRQNRREA